MNSLDLMHDYTKYNRCIICAVRHLSLCNVFTDKEVFEFNKIITPIECKSRDPIIDEGENANYVYNITYGAVKLFKLLPDGRRQITGFLFAGDFLGIALSKSYAYSAETISEAKLCRIQHRKLEELFDKFPKLEKRLLGIASNELIQVQEQMLLLGRKTAKEKLCSFLVNLSKREKKSISSKKIISVPMSRADIGDYLGLTTETISRTFTNLKSSGIIKLREGGIIEICNIDKLEDMADGI